MYAVGRLGSYITRGVYTVSGPFHPFGGAVDIIVVEQQDGSFKSSPWYVRFGKFQGVLKAQEKVVSININGVEADFLMYLDHKGEAYFLREVDVGETVADSYPSSSGDEIDEKSNSRMPQKSKSCSFVDDNNTDLVSHVEASNGKIVAGTSSSHSKFFGLVFGRRSVKQNGFQEEENAAGVGRASSLERAEMAADLLEVKWSTNLATRKRQKDGGSSVSDPNSSVSNLDGKFNAASVPSDKCSVVQDGIENKAESFLPLDRHHSPNDSDSEKLDHPMEITDSPLPCSINPLNYVEAFTLEETYLDVDLIPEGSRFSSTVGSRTVDNDVNAKGDMSEISNPNSNTSHSVEIEARLHDGDENFSTAVVFHKSSISETGAVKDEVPSIYSETSETITGGLDGSHEQDNEALDSAASLTRELHVHAQDFHDSLGQIMEVNSELQPIIPATNQNVQNSNITDCYEAPHQSKSSEGGKTSISFTGNITVQAELATESYIGDEGTMKQGTVDSIDLVEEVIKQNSQGEKTSISSTGNSTIETELAAESGISHPCAMKQGPMEDLFLVEEVTMQKSQGEKTSMCSTGKTTVEVELATQSDIGHQFTIKQGSVEDLNLVEKLIKETSLVEKTSTSSIGNCTVEAELPTESDIGQECKMKQGPLGDIILVEEVVKESFEGQKTSMSSTGNNTVKVELATESDIGHECMMKHGPVGGLNVVEEEDGFEGEKTSMSLTGNSTIEAEVATESEVSHQCTMNRGPKGKVDLVEQVVRDISEGKKTSMNSTENCTVECDLATELCIGHQCVKKQGPVDYIDFVEEIAKEVSEGDKISMCLTANNAVTAVLATYSDRGHQCTMNQEPVGDIKLVEEEVYESYEGDKISMILTGKKAPSKAAEAELSTESYMSNECCVKQGGIGDISFAEEEVKESSEAEKISMCSAGNSTISEVVEAEVAAEASIGHHCMVKRQSVEDIGVVEEVVKKGSSCPGLYLGGSSAILESEARSKDPCMMGDSFNSILLVDEHNFTGDVSRRSSNAKECKIDDILEHTVGEASSASSVEEQFAFSDLDDTKVQEVDHMECSSSYPVANELHDFLQSSGEEVNESTSGHNESHSCRGMVIEEDQSNDHPIEVENAERSSSPISFPGLHIDSDLESLSQIMESVPRMRTHAYGHHHLSRSLDSNFESLILMENNSPDLGSKKERVSGREDPMVDASHISEELKKIISDPAVELSLCRHLLYEGMGYEAASHAFDAEKLSIDRFASLGPEIMKNEKLVVRIGGLYFPWDAALPIASAIGSNGSQQILEPKGMIAVDRVEKTAAGNAQKSTDSKSASWRLWPFSFQRSRSVKSRNPDAENSSASHRGEVMDAERDSHTQKVTRKKIRANTPTSEQLASLNLKEGKNVVTFSFSTAMLGEQKVDARIFLWKWNTKIVISDVDGTITKSDVLGQFMPLVGLDWSQTGVAHLFSAIKENGYQLLFLSARSISQAYTTRQFLFNLKQDGKALPEGPVVISPDGLFPSLYREVIRRAPHEFKIACLEDIKALFPPDSHPFYAGFGNRDTDEISYLKVGIPKGKIFIINPKGQIAVNRRLDNRSYTSLHTLVHDMFPATSYQQEDYNSWNFWKLPPAAIDF
ncbi:hypothetical protein Ancab_016318 [Ancistrocladus abbreviatus]